MGNVNQGRNQLSNDGHMNCTFNFASCNVTAAGEAAVNVTWDYRNNQFQPVNLTAPFFYTYNVSCLFQRCFLARTPVHSAQSGSYTLAPACLPLTIDETLGPGFTVSLRTSAQRPQFSAEAME
jgi:hypothetical protein